MVGKLNLYLRLKPSLSSTADTSYFKINNNTEIQLLVPPNNREPYSFTEIFNKENDEVSSILSKQSIESALQGTNVTILAIGSKLTGKTHTIFGDLSPKGIKSSLSYSIVASLFESIRNTPKEKNCSITISFIEVDNEVVKDLGLAYYKREELRINEVMELLLGQDLEIKDVAGRGYVQDVCILQIMNPEEIVDIVSMGFKMKELIQSEGDCVLCITLSQRIKNDTQSARIYLVDSNSSSGLDISDNPVMTSLKKVLNKVNLTNLRVEVNNIPFKSSKVTYLLQGGLLNSNVCILAHIDTDPLKFRDSQEILNYSRSLIEIDKKIKLTMMARPNSSRTGDWAIRLKEEISELDSNIKKSQNLYEEKLRNFSKLIGIDEDFEVLLAAEKGSKEYDLCRKYREAVQTVKKLTQRNSKLEAKGEKFKKVMNELQILHLNNIEKNKRKMQELKDEIREAKETLEVFDEMKEKTMSEKVLASTENLEKMLYHSHFVLEEKSSGIQTIKTQMENNATDLRNILEIKDLGRAELENEYKKQIIDNEYQHKVQMKSLEDEYLKAFKAKDEEIVVARFETSQKKRDLNTLFSELENEGVNMFEIARLQGKAIYDIEKGKYNNGISPVLIPKTHIPPIPSETKFPIIFSALGSQALEVARVASKKKLQFNYTPKTNSFTNKTLPKEPEKPEYVMETSISSLLDSQVSSIHLGELRSIGTQLQKLIKQNAQKVSDLFMKNKEIEFEIERKSKELEEIVKEKEKYRVSYMKEVRNRMDVADKEAAKFEGNAFMTELGTRPSTQRYLNTASKMMRNIRTTVSGHRLPISLSSAKFDTIRPSTTLQVLKRVSSEKQYQ